MTAFCNAPLAVVLGVRQSREEKGKSTPTDHIPARILRIHFFGYSPRWTLRFLSRKWRFRVHFRFFEIFAVLKQRKAGCGWELQCRDVCFVCFGKHFANVASMTGDKWLNKILAFAQIVGCGYERCFSHWFDLSVKDYTSKYDTLTGIDYYWCANYEQRQGLHDSTALQIASRRSIASQGGAQLM